MRSFFASFFFTILPSQNKSVIARHYCAKPRICAESQSVTPCGPAAKASPFSHGEALERCHAWMLHPVLWWPHAAREWCDRAPPPRSSMFSSYLQWAMQPSSHNPKPQKKPETTFLEIVYYPKEILRQYVGGRAANSFPRTLEGILSKSYSSENILGAASKKNMSQKIYCKISHWDISKNSVHISTTSSPQGCLQLYFWEASS